MTLLKHKNVLFNAGVIHLKNNMIINLEETEINDVVDSVESSEVDLVDLYICDECKSKYSIDYENSDLFEEGYVCFCDGCINTTNVYNFSLGVKDLSNIEFVKR